MWIGNHTNHHIMGFLWLPILRYVEIFHTRLCTAVITPKTHFLLFSYKIEIVVTFIWILYVYQFTYLPYYDIVRLPIFITSFMVRSRIISKGLFILVCLWAIDLTSHMLILFAVLVFLFDPLREWLIFFKIGVGT